jgi:hypothetical protein
MRRECHLPDTQDVTEPGLAVGARRVTELIELGRDREAAELAGTHAGTTGDADVQSSVQEALAPMGDSEAPGSPRGEQPVVRSSPPAVRRPGTSPT